jgi:PfpI family intracellular protease
MLLNPDKEEPMDISGKRIAILATNGFEQSELEVPLKKLREAGATVDVVSLKSGEIKGWEKKDWGRAVPVDRTLDEAKPADYDALVLPGGQMNPDLLRVEPKAVDFVKAFWKDSKVIGAICHAPWLLVEAGIVKGLQVDQDRCHQRRRQVGGFRGRHRPGPRHQPASRRPRRLLGQADRGDRRGPPRAPRCLEQFQEKWEPVFRPELR